MKRQRPANGDIFGVPLPDDTYALGQVLGRERDALNSIGCAFFGAIARAGESLVGLPELLHQTPIAVLLTTPESLTKGIWPILANHTVVLRRKDIPYERFRSNGWVGVKIEGSGIIRRFLAAYHGQVPWDQFHDPNYLDGLLLPSCKRPTNVVLIKSQA